MEARTEAGRTRRDDEMSKKIQTEKKNATRKRKER